MTRNMVKRVEILFPVLAPAIKKRVMEILEIELQDNVKARDINKTNTNKYHKNRINNKVRAQVQTYHYLKNKHN